MIRVTVNRPVKLGRMELVAGLWWLDHVNAGQLLAQEGTSVEGLWAAPCVRAPGLGEDLRGRRVLLIRAGGLGDVLLLTPVIAELARRGVTVGVATTKTNGCVLEGNPHVSEVVSYPIADEELARWEGWISLEGAVEEAGDLHALDAMWNRVGVGGEMADRQLDYFVSAEELQWAKERFPINLHRRRLGVQMVASSPVRSYPHMSAVVRQMVERGWEVVIFGEPGKVQIEHSFGEMVKVLPMWEQPPTFRQSVAVAALCDCLVTPDSSLTHVAGALGVACVAVFGSFHWRARTADYETVRAIQGAGRCAPCWWHSKPGVVFPPVGACRTCGGVATGHCEVLAQIEPERVCRTIEAWTERMDERRRCGVR